MQNEIWEVSFYTQLQTYNTVLFATTPELAARVAVSNQHGNPFAKMVYNTYGAPFEEDAKNVANLSNWQKVCTSEVCVSDAPGNPFAGVSSKQGVAYEYNGDCLTITRVHAQNPAIEQQNVAYAIYAHSEPEDGGVDRDYQLCVVAPTAQQAINKLPGYVGAQCCGPATYNQHREVLPLTRRELSKAIDLQNWQPADDEPNYYPGYGPSAVSVISQRRELVLQTKAELTGQLVSVLFSLVQVCVASTEPDG